MTSGFNLINSADVSADHLSITFHLKQAYAPFLSVWVDSGVAPLPAHHFSSMPPEAILKQIFDQIHEIYLKELPFIVLFSLQNVALVHKGIHNYQFSPIANAGETNIWEWWCDGGKC